MDDDMEDEIICELFSAHLHLLWKYLSLTSSRVSEFLLPAPGESMKSKMLQPGPFMLITFLIILSSLLLQSRHNLLQKLILSCQQSITFNLVPDHGALKSFVSAAVSGGEQDYPREYVGGIAGVYALQGRRSAMEDRFSVLQDIEVGGKNKLSFFGVYDGHGGQFVADYVQEHLFSGTIDKIRHLFAALKDEKRNKNGMRGCNGAAAKESPQKRTVCREVSAENSDDESADFGEQKSSKSREGEAKEETPESGRADLEADLESPNEEIILKKEDPYTSVTLRKRSLAKDTCGISDKDEPVEENVFIDSNSNINYTRLLTDQIMAIDKQIVNRCKSRSDLSGTTAVVAVLDGELLIIGNVGDSRAVMGDMKGTTIPLSFDHKPNQLKEMRRIKEAGGYITFTGVWRVAGILATSRAIGDFPLKDRMKLITAEPDVLTFSLKDHKAHFVILASDGLWDVLSNEEAVEFVRSHIHEGDNGAKSLVMHAYNKGSMDNITVVILNFSKCVL